MYTLNSVEVHAVCYGLDTYNQNAEEEIMPTIRTNGGGDCIPKVAYAVENHPNDSRVKLADDDIVQALTSRMGTGGGNVPLVLFRKSRRAQSKDDFETWKEDNVTNTMNTFDRGDIRCTDAVVCKK